MSLVLIAALALGADPLAKIDAGAPKPAKPKTICVDVTPLGSRLGGRRVCHTAAEWDAERHDARDETERSQRLNTIHG